MEIVNCKLIRCKLTLMTPTKKAASAGAAPRWVIYNLVFDSNRCMVYL